MTGKQGYPDGASSKKLLEALLEVDTEAEVIAILKKAGLWDDPRYWRLYGDEEDNFSPAGAQQSSPEAALVEKAINAVDAALMGRALAAGIDPRSASAPASPREAVAVFYENATNGSIPESLGSMANWTPKKRTAVSRDITIALTGKRGKTKPSVSLGDAGEGQEPRRLPDTILSLLSGNKKSISFVQGKFNMGGTGALRFCGYSNLQLVLSKRRPEVAKREGASTAWGFSVVRRDNPSESSRVSTYRYLAPVGASDDPEHGEVLSFEADEMPIFPVGQQPYARAAAWGTLLKLYEYDTKYDGHFFMKGGLLQRLDMMMPGLMLPIRLHECRAFRGEERSFETTLTGLEVRLRAQETQGEEQRNLEPGFPDSGTITVDGEAIKYTIYAFRRNRHESYKTTQGILYVVNGQTHAIRPDSFFNRGSVGLGYLAKSLLVVLDCTDLSDRTKEDLFMNSRDRLADARMAQRIESELSDLMKRHTGLQDLKNRRRQEDTASKIGDSKPVEEVLRDMLKRSPSLARLFFPGTRLSNPFATVEVKVGKKFVGKLHPTFFRFRDRDYGKVLDRNAHLEQRARLTFETDVANDYFRRAYKPGRLTITATLNGGEVTIDGNTNLFEGSAHVNVGLPKNAKAGDVLRIRVEVDDETLVEPFINDAILRVVPAQQQQQGTGTRTKRPTPEKEGETEKRPAGISIPEPTPVYREKWRDYSGFKMDGSSCMRAVIGEATDGEGPQIGAYDLFINMDNEYLRAEQKAHTKNAEMIAYRYKFGMTLVSIAAIRYVGELKKAAEKDPVDEEDDNGQLEVEDMIEAITDALAPALLPMIDILGELDEDDLAQAATDTAALSEEDAA